MAPRLLSESLPSLMGSLKGRFVNESQSASALPLTPEREAAKQRERLESLKASALNRLSEFAKCRTAMLAVPRAFQARARFDLLAKWLGREGKKALEYCKAFADNPSMKGPMLMGKSGCGKTHLLWATAKVIADRQKERVRNHQTTVENETIKAIEEDKQPPEYHWPPPMDLLVTDGAEIAHEIRESVRRSNLDDVVARYRQNRILGMGGDALLFVDDVEVMKMGDWLHEELYRIFNYRYREGLTTVCVSNLAPEELKAHLGDRLTRRILDLTEPFEL